MKEEIKVLELDKYELGILINALNEFRNAKLQENIDTEIIDKLIMNLLHAPTNKKALSLNKHAKGRYTIEGR